MSAVSVRLRLLAPFLWRYWPRGIGTWLWPMTQEFNSPIPPQQFWAGHWGAEIPCKDFAVGSIPTQSTKICESVFFSSMSVLQVDTLADTTSLPPERDGGKSRKQF
jgi:hypothetical protein